MDEQLQGGIVKAVGLGKGERLAHKAGQKLAQGVVMESDSPSVGFYLSPDSLKCRNLAGGFA